jgi:3-polyprenyl-4-hydroxybenzoate decarboxylase
VKKAFLPLICLLVLFSGNRRADEIFEFIKKKTHPMTFVEGGVAAEEINSYRQVLGALLQGLPIISRDFQVENFGDMIVLHDPRDIHPTVVINSKGKRQFIIEAPHSGLEQSTPIQAAILLKELDAKAALISGSHRCAAREYSPCSGKTGVCGVRGETYKISDSAHSMKNLFQSAHEELVDYFKQARVIQLHEMRKTETAIKIILSSTALAYSQNENDFVTSVRELLKREHSDPLIAVSCNALDDRERTFRKLCGFTNTQGRYLNESTNICSEYTKIDNDRFLHIEQDYTTSLKPEFMQALINALKRFRPMP